MKKLINRNIIKKIVWVLFLSTVISCNEEDIPGEKERQEEICDLDFIESYEGTACCVTGFIEASPGDTLQYDYFSNLINTSVTWGVVEGDIILIAGQGSSTSTFVFGNNFSTGSIKGFGEGNNSEGGIELCSAGVDISRW